MRPQKFSRAEAPAPLDGTHKLSAAAHRRGGGDDGGPAREGPREDGLAERDQRSKPPQSQDGVASANASLWSSRKSDQDTPVDISNKERGAPRVDVEAAKEQVAAAIKCGRWLEAQRKLRSIETAAGAGATAPTAGLVDGVLRERVARVAARYDASLAELSAREDDGWEHEHCEGQGLDFAYRLASSSLQVVASTVFRGIDALHAFVGLCEYDLCAKYTSQVISTEPLGSVEAGDGLWHVLKRATVGKEDNILHVSYIDALDEPLGALWVSAYVPSELDEPPTSGGGWPSKVGGVAVPQPSQGSVRLGFWRTAYAITPLWGEDAGGGQGGVPAVRLTFSLCRRPSNARCILRCFMRREVDEFVATFKRLMEDCSDLQARVHFSRNAGLYDSVRRHLETKAPKPLAPSPKLLGAPSPKVAALAASPVPAVVVSVPATPAILSLAELSAHLPEDWADYCEAYT